MNKSDTGNPKSTELYGIPCPFVWYAFKYLDSMFLRTHPAAHTVLPAMLLTRRRISPDTTSPQRFPHPPLPRAVVRVRSGPSIWRVVFKKAYPALDSEKN